MWKCCNHRAFSLPWWSGPGRVFLEKIAYLVLPPHENSSGRSVWTQKKRVKTNIYIYVSVYLHANNVAVKTPPQLFVQSALTVTFKGLTGDGRSSVWQWAPRRCWGECHHSGVCIGSGCWPAMATPPRVPPGHPRSEKHLKDQKEAVPHNLIKIKKKVLSWLVRKL